MARKIGKSQDVNIVFDLDSQVVRDVQREAEQI